GWVISVAWSSGTNGISTTIAASCISAVSSSCFDRIYEITSNDIKREIHSLKRAAKQTADAIEHDHASGARINVARRTNIKVATNFGRNDSTQHASATQSAEIVQDGSPTAIGETDHKRGSA
ncbi:MAG: hypothetical protein LC793_21420, partial [Thermomicrobia bacterium]|nr:hypothetical protein [Thermomicrobia bacterium]